MRAALKAELGIQLTGPGVAALYSPRLCKLPAVMCTSIIDRRHAGFKNGGAFVILTQRGGGGGEVRIRGSGADRAGVKIGVLRLSGTCRRVRAGGGGGGLG